MPDIESLPTPTTIQASHGFIERIVAEPLLVHPMRAAELQGCLLNIVGRERFEEMSARLDTISHDDYWPEPDSWEYRFKPYNVVNGVLQIPVMGALINRMGYQLGAYATGYTYIEKTLDRGLEDGNVRGIAFIHNSLGGETAGNFELNDRIYEARGRKPMRAFVADVSYSGSFSIATAADEVIITRSGRTGSVGVVIMHVDMSGMLANQGLKVTFTTAGEYKVDGNQYEPLSDTARQRFQAQVDKIYDVFVSTVARNRGIEENRVRETEALTYDSDESIEIGFADRLGVLENEVAAFELEVAEQDGEVPMTMTDETVTRADHDAAVEEATQAGRSEGARATQERFAAVMSSEHYAGREAQATRMLTDAKMAGVDAETIIGILQASPRVEPTPPGSDNDDSKARTSVTNHFKEHMDAEGGPQVGAGTDEDAQDENTPEANAARIIAASRMAAGKSPKNPGV